MALAPRVSRPFRNEVELTVGPVGPSVSCRRDVPANVGLPACALERTTRSPTTSGKRRSSTLGRSRRDVRFPRPIPRSRDSSGPSSKRRSRMLCASNAASGNVTPTMRVSSAQRALDVPVEDARDREQPVQAACDAPAHNDGSVLRCERDRPPADRRGRRLSGRPPRPNVTARHSVSSRCIGGSRRQPSVDAETRRDHSER